MKKFIYLLATIVDTIVEKKSWIWLLSVVFGMRKTVTRKQQDAIKRLIKIVIKFPFVKSLYVIWFSLLIFFAKYQQLINSSGPAARRMAPSTPPPPSKFLLAALTMAFTFIVVISFRTIWKGMTTPPHLIGSSYHKRDYLAIQRNKGTQFYCPKYLMDHSAN